MRLTLDSIQDVCDELKQQAEFIYDQTVRVQVQAVPQQQEGISHDVIVTVTALIEKDMLIEFMQPAGVDGPGDTSEGSKLAKAWVEQLQEACDAADLNLRHGKLDLI